MEEQVAGQMVQFVKELRAVVRLEVLCQHDRQLEHLFAFLGGALKELGSFDSDESLLLVTAPVLLALNVERKDRERYLRSYIFGTREFEANSAAMSEGAAAMRDWLLGQSDAVKRFKGAT